MPTAAERRNAIAKYLKENGPSTAKKIVRSLDMNGADVRNDLNLDSRFVRDERKVWHRYT